MTTDPFQLASLVDAVKQSGADIAPTYNEYLQLAFALASDCGESGRSVFHELCCLSPKYRQADADRLFDAALRNGRGEVHLGTVFHLARQAGVTVDEPSTAETDNLQNLRNLHPTRFLTHAHAYNKVYDEPVTGTDPALTLPVFAEHRWPELVAESCRHGSTPAQRDVLLLTTLTTLGACMGKQVRCLYGGKRHSPCLQLFVVAPPASGKGVMSFVRKFAEVLHLDIRREVDKAMEAYQKEKQALESMGKARANTKPPQPPKNRMFIIPGNNTGTGILQNLMDSGGEGLIFETEADTISTAIGGDYGHWSDTLRKAFDHDPLAYNRRTDREYREIQRSYLSVVLSGTPAQVAPLIPSAENGLFSRQLFYYMPGINEWRDPFEGDESGTEEVFGALADKWRPQLELLRRNGIYDLMLTPRQKAEFNQCFTRLFSLSTCCEGNEMTGSVARLGIIACRLLSVVAVLRMLEAGGPHSGYPDICPAPDVADDNLKDGIITRWEVGIGPDDFEAVMGLIEPLYRHATHVLSFLPAVSVKRRPNADQSLFFSQLPETFTRKQLLQLAEKNGINTARADSWLYRLIQAKLVTPQAQRGVYIKQGGL